MQCHFRLNGNTTTKSGPTQANRERQNSGITFFKSYPMRMKTVVHAKPSATRHLAYEFMRREAKFLRTCASSKGKEGRREFMFFCPALLGPADEGLRARISQPVRSQPAETPTEAGRPPRPRRRDGRGGGGIRQRPPPRVVLRPGDALLRISPHYSR